MIFHVLDRSSLFSVIRTFKLFISFFFFFQYLSWDIENTFFLALDGLKQL